MDSQRCLSKCLNTQGGRAVLVMMENLPAHKVDSIKPMIEAVGSYLVFVYTLLILNPIELWWSQLKSLLLRPPFSITTTKGG